MKNGLQVDSVPESKTITLRYSAAEPACRLYSRWRGEEKSAENKGKNMNEEEEEQKKASREQR